MGRKRGPKRVKRYDNEFHWKTKRKKTGPRISE